MGPYRAFRQGESAALAAPALSWSLVILRVSFSTWTATLHYKDRPPGASMAARISEGKGSGVRMSVFSLGGSLGWAIGPLIAVGLVGWVGGGPPDWCSRGLDRATGGRYGLHASPSDRHGVGPQSSPKGREPELKEVRCP